MEIGWRWFFVMPKFFVKQSNIKDGHIIIDGSDLNHIKNVFRFSIGDNLTLSDGNGMDYYVEILEQNSKYINSRIINRYPTNSEPCVNVTLYQGIPKSTKMDFIIQKTVELGVHEVVPVLCDRTVVKFSTDKDVKKKVERWQKIASEASKQCGRGIIPNVRDVITLKEAVDESIKFDLSIIPYEKEKINMLKNAIERNAKNVSVFIGPEGGFTTQEVEMSIKNNIVPVTLGNRILRAETASIYTMSVIMYELDQD